MEMYIIIYSIKYAIKNNGEYINDTQTRKESMIQTSNYLPELFNDIYQKHRHEWLVGVEIDEVLPFHSIDLEKMNCVIN